MEMFGGGGEGVVTSLKAGSLDSELLRHRPGTQPRVTLQMSPDFLAHQMTLGAWEGPWLMVDSRVHIPSGS